MKACQRLKVLQVCIHGRHFSLKVESVPVLEKIDIFHPEPLIISVKPGLLLRLDRLLTCCQQVTLCDDIENLITNCQQKC